jgi:Coenzyme PQQ synthesis protein D (PqqD)
MWVKFGGPGPRRQMPSSHIASFFSLDREADGLHETDDVRVLRLLVLGMRSMSRNAPSNQGPASNPKPSPDVLWQRFDNEVVLVQLRTDRFLSLNATAARFWELLAAGTDVHSIKEELAEEFGVAAVDLDAEIEAILKTMTEEELIVF